MLHYTRRLFIVLSALIALLIVAGGGRVVPVSADGTNDAFIRQEYGSTRSQDGGGNDAANGDSFVCHTSGVPNFAGDANRGNLMTLDAYNSNVDNSWYFAWVVDSSHALNDTAGNFFGNSAARQVNYILGIDTGAAGNDLGVGGDMNGAPNTAWPRFFSFNNQVDYFVPLYPTGADTMNAQIWGWDAGGNKVMFVDNFPVTTRVVDFRRIVELHLDPTLTGMPAALVGNNQIRVVLVSTEATNDQNGNGDNSESDGGRVIDSLGAGSHVNGCNMGYQGGTSISSLLIETQPFCHNVAYQNAVGEAHPYLLDNGTRQCLSNPALETIPALNPAGFCEATYEGIEITGDVAFNNTDYNNTPQSGKPGYVYLTEFEHAAPYRLLGGGTRSDFKGESSAYQYYDGDPYTLRTTTGTADLVNAFVRTDACYLYIHVDGTDAVGRDNSSLYVAIDRSAVTSGTNAGSMLGYDPGPDAPNAPDNKRVNFKNWDPDYIWNVDGWTNADLFDHTGSGWTSIKNFTNTRPGRSDRGQNDIYEFTYNDCPNLVVDDIRWATNGANDLNSNNFGTEVAIPWAVIGGIPDTSEPIRIGLYTAWNAGGNAAYDVHDQAPGVGQGCFGYGCHERIGDEPHDKDGDFGDPDNNNDNSPFSGRNYGDNGDAPASDWSSDVDTIEAYFIFTPEVDRMQCNAPVRDFGDLPDTTTPGATQTYATQALVEGPSHIIRNSAGVNTPVYLGACVDGDANGQPSLLADGDNGALTNSTPAHTVGTCATAGNDEDGIQFLTPLIPGQQACVSVTAVVPSGTPRLNAFIDWNGNGTLAPVNFTSGGGGGTNPTVANGTATYCFDVPANAAHSGTLYSRFRLSTQGSLAATGPANDGEVEDYVMPLTCVGNRVWFDTNADGQQAASGEPGMSGVTVRLAYGSNTYTTTTDSNGNYAFCGLIAGDYTVSIPTTPTGYQSTTVGTNDTTTPGDANNPAGVPFTVSFTGLTGQQPTGENGPTDTPGSGYSNYPDNKVNETIDFGFVARDFGDLPASFVATTLAQDGARHIITPSLYLGACVDAESNGQPSVGATGDDGNADSVNTLLNGSPLSLPLGTACADDEDGIVPVVAVWTPGQQACVTVTAVNTTGGNANLWGWIDFDRTGTFTTANALTGGSGGTGGNFSGGVATVSNNYSGANTFCFEIPAGVNPFANATVCARFRLTTDTLTSSSWVGAAANGEVEDYCWTFSPTAIDLDWFEAVANADGSVTVAWATAAEWDHAGFNVYRSSSQEMAGSVMVNTDLIAAQGLQGQGAEYELLDSAVAAGLWYYFLEDVDINGVTTLHGPVSVTVGEPLAVGLRSGAAAGNQAALWLVAIMALGLGSTLLLTRRQR